MGIKTRTITEYTCDLCGVKCEDCDSSIQIQVSQGDGRDVGPGYLKARFTVELPYQVSKGNACSPCISKWLHVYVKNEGMA